MREGQTLPFTFPTETCAATPGIEQITFWTQACRLPPNTLLSVFYKWYKNHFYCYICVTKLTFRLFSYYLMWQSGKWMDVSARNPLHKQTFYRLTVKHLFIQSTFHLKHIQHCKILHTSLWSSLNEQTTAIKGFNSSRTQYYTTKQEVGRAHNEAAQMKSLSAGDSASHSEPRRGGWKARLWKRLRL